MAPNPYRKEVTRMLVHSTGRTVDVSSAWFVNPALAAGQDQPMRDVDNIALAYHGLGSTTDNVSEALTATPSSDS